jgi:hypothetical protein
MLCSAWIGSHPASRNKSTAVKVGTNEYRDETVPMGVRDPAAGAREIIWSSVRLLSSFIPASLSFVV